MIKAIVLLLSSVLCALPVWAGTSHVYIPNEAMYCQSLVNVIGPGDCAKTYFDTAFGVGSYFHYPITAMPATSDANLQTTFFFPASHVQNNGDFDITIHYATGGAGNKKYCWYAGLGIVPDSISGGLYWGSLYGIIGSTYSISATNNTVGPGYKVSATSLGTGNPAFRAGVLTSPATQCTYARCANQPGILSVQRDSACAGSTTDTAYIIGVDVSWYTFP